MNCLARRARPTLVWAGCVCAAALLLTSACHTPRETRSVNLPLAVGNRWVYDVTWDSGAGTAVLEVASRDKDGYGLSMSGDFGHLGEPDTLLHLRCRDTVLWLLSAVERDGRVWWASVLSDDPNDSCTQTLLLYRLKSGSAFSSQTVGTMDVGGDTFRDCLRLSCVRVSEQSYILGGWRDTTWVQEYYAPDVGIVRADIEQHWSSWGWFIDFFSNSGTWVDCWELREYSLAE
jgi:hypothetical protein